MDPNSADIDEELKRRFSQLPKPVQNAITSADVQKRMRELAKTHQLHLDQWDVLDTEVQMTLLGIQQPNDLAKNILAHVGVAPDTSSALAHDINMIVFEPIRQELERELGSPQAKKVEVGDLEKVRQDALAQAPKPVTAPAVVENPAPASVPPSNPTTTNPPAPEQNPSSQTAASTPTTQDPDTQKAIRAPISASYSAQKASTERKSVEGDPYREQIA